MMAIGDGVLAAVFPVQHIERWDYGPRAWRAYLHWFIERPGLCRVLGVAEVIGGIAWAASLPSATPSDPRSYPRRPAMRPTAAVPGGLPAPPSPAGRTRPPKWGPARGPGPRYAPKVPGDQPSTTEVRAMAYAVIRHYKGSGELIDELGRRAGEVENLIRGVSGFQNYYLVRSDDGGFSVSVFEDRAGAEESVKAARQFIQDTLADVAGAPPEVIQGEVTITFSGQG